VLLLTHFFDKEQKAVQDGLQVPIVRGIFIISYFSLVTIMVTMV